MFTLLTPFLALLAGAKADDSSSSSSKSPDAVQTANPYQEPLLVTFVADPDSLTSAANGGFKDLTVYSEIDDNSWDALSEDDKKPPHFPANNQTLSHLGQMKTLKASKYGRSYSWEAKGGVINHCSVFFQQEPGVAKSWVWVDSGNVEMWKDGKPVPQDHEKKTVFNNCAVL